MFNDRARIRVQAGRGGDGSRQFRREKHVPRGGPDGGDGGPGGDVVLVADPDLRDLSAFRVKRRYKAGRGEPGRGALKHGATGESLELRVPVGTQVLDGQEQVIADLAAPGARMVAARGGNAGRGNKRFATPTRRAPRFAETGLPGDEATLDLRLKLVADAALVGLPNAGKSLLLTRISNARPKVAEYPFTTLAPVLGTVDAPDRSRQLTVADVPGLIEGASQGVGLGHEFLAHLERANILLHVIDAAEDDAATRFATIDQELGAYGAGLDQRPQVLATRWGSTGGPSKSSDAGAAGGHVHPAALRAPRPRRCCKRALRSRRSRRSRRGAARAQGGGARRRDQTAPCARRFSRLRRRARPLRANGRPAPGRALARSDLSGRRRRVLRVPDVEGTRH